MGYYVKTQNCTGLSIFYFGKVATESNIILQQLVQNKRTGRITTAGIEMSFLSNKILTCFYPFCYLGEKKKSDDLITLHLGSL